MYVYVFFQSLSHRTETRRRVTQCWNAREQVVAIAEMMLRDITNVSLNTVEIQ